MAAKTKASDYKLAHEADNHFVVRHPDGSHFKVAKKGLDAKARQRISQMPQHFDEGGDVQPEMLATPGREVASQPEVELPPGDPMDFRAQAGIPSAAQGLASIKDALSDTRGPSDDALAGREPAAPSLLQPRTVANASIGKGALASTDDVAPPSATGGFETSVGAPKQVAPKADPNDPMALYNKSFGMQKAGIQGIANAATEQAKQTAMALDSADMQNRMLMANTAKHEQDFNKEREGLEKDYREGKINPNNVYENMSTGNRILAGIGLVLGGLGGGLNKTGVNPAMEVINNAISRDMDAQKANLDKKQNLLKLNFEKTRDMHQAAMLTQSQLLSAAKIQTEMAAAKAQGPTAQANAQMLLGGIDQQQAQLQMSLAQMKAKADLTSGGGAPLSPFLAGDKEIAGRVVTTNVDANGRPLYHLAGSEESAKTQKSVENDAKTVLQNISQMKKIASSPSSAISPEQRALFDNLKTQVGAQLGTLSGVNRYNTDEANLNKDTLGKLGIGQATGATMTKLNQAEDFLNRLRENSRQTHLLNYRSPYQATSARPHVATR